MGMPVLPLSGIAYGQQLAFHGIFQRAQFPVYVEPDYKQVLGRSYEVHPYDTVVAAYDAGVPSVERFINEILSYLPKGRVSIRMPLVGGEQLKTLEQVVRITKWLGASAVGDKSVMLVIGGGTLCNLAGFVATMWNGMEIVFVPTNYTAIADVAVGSLHMINVGTQKNRLQLYYDPLAVAYDSRFIVTLPISERRSGLVETIKHGIAQDGVLFEQIERLAEDGKIFDDANVFDLAIRTAQLKEELMKTEPFSEHAQNIFLYGHVIAHAIEAAMNYSVPHGEAVSLGLLVELAFYYSPETASFIRVKHLLDKLGLPTKMPHTLTTEKILAQLFHAMTHDGTLLIPHIGQIGALEAVLGCYSEKFDIEKVRNALSVII